MFYVIEKKEQLDFLKNTKQCFIQIIPGNFNFHSKISSIKNNISLIYFKSLDINKGFIICIDHSESLHLEYNLFLELINNIEIIYTIDKKNLLYYLKHPNIVDVNFNLKEYIDIEKYYTNIHNKFYHHYNNHESVNKIISISKHYELYENIFFDIKDFIYIPDNINYLNDFINVFYEIEKQGISLDKNEYLKHFDHIPYHEYNIYNNRIFTHYNLYTLTSRPSNAFNNINFAALNKKNNERAIIKNNNDYLIEYDFDGYHLRLIGKLINYNFNNESVHIQLGKVYFNKDEINNEEYNSSKLISFEHLYGQNKKYAHIEFFKKTQKYIKEIYNILNKNGYIKCNISDKIFYLNDLKNINPQKLFNYIIQNYETSCNVLILKKLIDYLKDKHTKIILYTYDAILFDYSLKDGKQCLIDIQNIMNFPTKCSIGKRYNSLNKF